MQGFTHFLHFQSLESLVCRKAFLFASKNTAVSLQHPVVPDPHAVKTVAALRNRFLRVVIQARATLQVMLWCLHIAEFTPNGVKTCATTQAVQLGWD